MEACYKSQAVPLDSVEEVQRALAQWNSERFAPSFPEADYEIALARDAEMRRLEGHFVEELRTSVGADAAKAPTNATAFVAWFEELANSGPGQGDPLFPWLAREASREQICWFMQQEAAGEAGFEDLVAYAQVKLPTQPKLELARNYWDEMGRGNPNGMHGPLFDRVIDTLGLQPSVKTTVWQSLALANAMTAMATTRRYTWHAIGALGVNELVAPERSALTAAALRRIGLSDRQRRYFDLHAMLEVKHSADWNREVLLPLVTDDPARAIAIAEGALIRLTCNARCFEEYRHRLW